VNSASGAYTIYPVGGTPRCAGDGARTAWWSAYDSNGLGRLSTGSNKMTIWEIPSSVGLGTALDESAGVGQRLLQFVSYKRKSGEQRNITVRCQLGVGEYLLWKKPASGLATTWWAHRAPGDNLCWWNLPTGGYPRDLALDGNSRVWWTDLNKGYVGRLITAGRIITFTRPSAARHRC
jgi:streptogramin lyase